MRRVILGGSFFCGVLFAPISGAVDHCVSTNNQTSASMEKTTPEAQFTVAGDKSTVTDKRTNLMWQYCAVGYNVSGGICVRTDPAIAVDYSWVNALAAVATVNTAAYATFSDWRLPNIKELATTIERTCTAPAINKLIFPTAPAATFWSSTASGSAPGVNAWLVDFSTGNVSSSPQSTSAAVRLVRDITP